MRIDGDYIIFSSGRTIQGNAGIIGLGPDLFAYCGYDNGLGLPNEQEWWLNEEITADDKRELADYMIDLWARFKEAVE